MRWRSSWDMSPSAIRTSHLHDTGKRGDKIFDEYLTTVCRLRANKSRRLDTSISEVEMLNAFFV